jgi:phage terminase small subunit
MSGNVSDTEEKQLSPKQEMLIAALVAGNSIVASAKTVGIAEKTAHSWLKQPLFQKEYQAAKQAAFDETLDTLRKGTSIALKTLLKHITSEETKPYVQVQAASKWLDLAIDVHKREKLDALIDELEDLVKGQQR